MKEATPAIVSVLLAIIGVAIVAVLVSNNANTVSVIGASGNAFSNDLRCALGPVIGGGQGYCGTTSSSTITFK